VQFLNLARNYPSQPEGGAFLKRDFVETADDSASAALIASHAEMGKRKRVIDFDQVEDSEEL
jgi:hypothetical protein